MCVDCAYTIVKVTKDMMTAHKGVWSWTAQEIHEKSPVFGCSLGTAPCKIDRFA